MELKTRWDYTETIARLCNYYPYILSKNIDDSVIYIEDFIKCLDTDRIFSFSIKDNWKEKYIYISILNKYINNSITPHSTPLSNTPNSNMSWVSISNTPKISRGNSPAIAENTFSINEVINKLNKYKDNYIKINQDINILDIIHNYLINILEQTEPIPFIIYKKINCKEYYIMKGNKIFIMPYFLSYIKYQWTKNTFIK